MRKLCLGLTGKLIEKQRRKSDFLIVMLKTIVYIKDDKSSCEKNFANRTNFLITCRFFITVS